MGEKITITLYDGHAINDGSTYSAYFLAEDEPLSTFESSIIQAEVAGDFPNYVRGQPGGRVYPLKVKVLGTPSLANIRTLKAWMTPHPAAPLAPTPADWTLTPAGSARCYPTFEFTPTVSKNHANYWKRRRHIIIANTVERTLTSTNGER